MALRPPPPLIALACLALAWGLDLAVRSPVLAPRPWNLAGLALVVAGLGLAGAGIRAFRVRRTAVHPWQVPSAFVAEGPYRFTRNPMYLGLAVGTLGLAVVWGTLAMLLAPVLFLAVLDRWVVPWEERTLEEAFGEPYRAYKARVRRWL